MVSARGRQFAVVAALLWAGCVDLRELNEDYSLASHLCSAQCASEMSECVKALAPSLQAGEYSSECKREVTSVDTCVCDTSLFSCESWERAELCGRFSACLCSSEGGEAGASTGESSGFTSGDGDRSTSGFGGSTTEDDAGSSTGFGDSSSGFGDAEGPDAGSQDDLCGGEEQPTSEAYVCMGTISGEFDTTLCIDYPTSEGWVESQVLQHCEKYLEGTVLGPSTISCLRVNWGQSSRFRCRQRAEEFGGAPRFYWYPEPDADGLVLEGCSELERGPFCSDYDGP